MLTKEEYGSLQLFITSTLLAEALNIDITIAGTRASKIVSGMSSQEREILAKKCVKNLDGLYEAYLIAMQREKTGE